MKDCGSNVGCHRVSRSGSAVDGVDEQAACTAGDAFAIGRDAVEEAEAIIQGNLIEAEIVADTAIVDQDQRSRALRRLCRHDGIGPAIADTANIAAAEDA